MVKAFISDLVCKKKKKRLQKYSYYQDTYTKSRPLNNVFCIKQKNCLS